MQQLQFCRAGRAPHISPWHRLPLGESQHHPPSQREGPTVCFMALLQPPSHRSGLLARAVAALGFSTRGLWVQMTHAAPPCYKSWCTFERRAVCKLQSSSASLGLPPANTASSPGARQHWRSPQKPGWAVCTSIFLLQQHQLMPPLCSLATKQSHFLSLLTDACTIAPEMVPTTNTQQIEALYMNDDSKDIMEEYQRVRQKSGKGRGKNECFSCLSVPIVMWKVIKHPNRLAQKSKQAQLIGQRHWHFISRLSSDSEQWRLPITRHPPVFLIFSYQQDKTRLTPFLENFLLEEKHTQEAPCSQCRGNFKARVGLFPPCTASFRRLAAKQTVSLHGLGLESLQKANRGRTRLNRRRISLKSSKVIPSKAFYEQQQEIGPEKQVVEVDSKRLLQWMLQIMTIMIMVFY